MGGYGRDGMDNQGGHRSAERMGMGTMTAADTVLLMA